MRLHLALLLLTASWIAPAGEAPPTFTTKPTAARAGDKVKIEFAVDRETDVAVFIEDAKGRVVRHLVAGVLGKNPPPPLKPGLAQSAEWDGRDDDGKPAEGGPFSVRVGLSLAPRLDKYLFDDPGAVHQDADGLAVDSQGNLYLTTDAGGVYWFDTPGNLTRVYSREGAYRRTLQPFSAAIAPAKLAGTGAFVVDGHVHPAFHAIEKMRMYPGIEIRGHEHFVTPAGRIARLVSDPADAYRIRMTDLDGGSVTVSPPVSPAKMAAEKCNRRVWMAMGQGGRHVYLGGLMKGKDAPLHAVWRTPLGDDGAASTVFAGQADTSGNDEKHLNTPMGVAADGKGLLFVADYGNDRIVAFREEDGTVAQIIPADKPAGLAVDPGTGVLYVLLDSSSKGMHLVRIERGNAPRETGRIALKGTAQRSLLALDASAKPPVFWVGGYHASIVRIEERGSAFGEPRDMKSKAFSPGNCEDLVVDRARDELYFKMDSEKFARVDLRTGKETPLRYPPAGGAAGTGLALSPDGNTVYAWGYEKKQGFQKFDRDFKRLTFEAVGADRVMLKPAMTFASRSLGVAPNGDIYLMPKFLEGPVGEAVSQLEIYSPDGRRKSTAIWRCYIGATGPRFDRQGNIYILDTMKDRGKAVPDFFKNRLPDFGPKEWKPRWAYSSPVGSVAIATGSIVKFPPTGGWIGYAPQAHPGKSGSGQEEVPAAITALPAKTVSYLWPPADKGGLLDVEVKGALWHHYGASPIHTKATGDCNCQGSRFDVDDFGRVFFPDVCRFRVGVIDTNGNEIASIGHYGNRDSGGPGSGSTSSPPDAPGSSKGAVPEPAIAFAYPYAVACSRTHVLVGDLLNNRIAMIRLAYAVEAQCRLP